MKLAGAYINDDTYERLAALAAENNRTLAGQCRHLFDRALRGELEVPACTPQPSPAAVKPQPHARRGRPAGTRDGTAAVVSDALRLPAPDAQDATASPATSPACQDTRAAPAPGPAPVLAAAAASASTGPACGGPCTGRCTQDSTARATDPARLVAAG